MIIKVDKSVDKEKLLDVLFRAGYEVEKWKDGNHVYDIHRDSEIKEEAA